MVSCISCDNLDAHRRCGHCHWPTLIGMKVHTFCALSPRLGGIMGARHRPYGRGILAVGPSLIANWFLVFLLIISMPIGVVAYAHRHQGTYFLRIIAKARRHYGRQASALWPRHIGSLPEPHRELVATANLGCPSALRPTLIGIKVHTFCRIIAKARRRSGR